MSQNPRTTLSVKNGTQQARNTPKTEKNKYQRLGENPISQNNTYDLNHNISEFIQRLP